MSIFKHKAFLVLAAAVIILSLLPALQIFFKTQGAWHGVIPEYPKDATFYLARIVQVSHGYFFIGNPYIREYRNAPALSFFVPEWLTAVPLALGISLPGTVLLNIVIWSLIFCAVSYVLFSKLKLSPWQSAAAAFLSYTQVYWLMLRPVVMQTVFPAYLLFMLAYLLWFNMPTSRKRIVFLALVSALTFYIYTFLWQIVCVTFALTYLYLFIQKRWGTIRALLVSNALAALGALPMLAYTVHQASSQFYWETLNRVNLVYTRMLPPEFYYYGRWVFVAMGLCLMFTLFKRKNDQPDDNKNLFAIVCITGVSLLISSASNVVLNKEVDTASHIGRFITMWFSVIFLTVIVRMWSQIRNNAKAPKWLKFGIAAIILIVAVGYARNSYRAMSYSNVVHQDVVALQDYSIPLNWLEQHSAPEDVVWVLNPKIATYVPIMTHDYILFHLNAASYLMPSLELEDRYLTSHYFDNLSVADLKRDLSEYAGAGTRSKYEAHNRWVGICQKFYLEKLGYACGHQETEASYKGEPYFSELYDRNIRVIMPQINDELEKYHVAYLVIDREHDILKKPLKDIKGLSLGYVDARFEIYKFSSK